MVDFDVRRLAAQLDAAEKILEEIRITSGCEAFGSERRTRPERIGVALEAACKAVSDRQRRTRFVGSSEMFGEPAWDILLDLFIRQTNEETGTVTSACLSSGTTATTAVRWLAVLEQNELILSEPDPDDTSRKLIRLTPMGYEGMLRYLENVAS